MLERTKNIDLGLVYDLWREYAAAMNAGDLKRWMALWSDDGIQMPPGVPRRLGKAEIRREMRPLFDPEGRRRISIQPEEVRILGARAYAHGTYELEFEGGGEIRRCSGKFLNILEKQVDGSWKIAVDCHNHSEPFR